MTVICAELHTFGHPSCGLHVRPAHQGRLFQRGPARLMQPHLCSFGRLNVICRHPGHKAKLNRRKPPGMHKHMVTYGPLLRSCTSLIVLSSVIPQSGNSVPIVSLACHSPSASGLRREWTLVVRAPYSRLSNWSLLSLCYTSVQRSASPGTRTPLQSQILPLAFNSHHSSESPNEL